MDTGRSVFWDDLASDLQDPEFLREYVAESIRIATIDRIVNELDAARTAAGLTKADLARAISSEPSDRTATFVIQPRQPDARRSLAERSPGSSRHASRARATGRQRPRADHPYAA